MESRVDARKGQDATLQDIHSATDVGAVDPRQSDDFFGCGIFVEEGDVPWRVRYRDISHGCKG